MNNKPIFVKGDSVTFRCGSGVVYEVTDVSVLHSLGGLKEERVTLIPKGNPFPSVVMEMGTENLVHIN